MKNLFRMLITLTISSIVFLSCQKKDDDQPAPLPAPTKTDMLAGSWEMISWLQLVGNDTLGDIVNSPELQCFIDNIESFYKDGRHEIDEGLTTCEPDDLQLYWSGKWSFNSDETELNLYNLIPYKILKLSTTELILKKEPDGVNFITNVYGYRKI